VVQSRPAQTDSTRRTFGQSVSRDCIATKWSFLPDRPVPPAPPGLHVQPMQHRQHVRQPGCPYPLQAFVEKQRLLPPLFTPCEPLLAPPRAHCSYRPSVTTLRAPLLLQLESMGVTTELCKPQANTKPPRDRGSRHHPPISLTHEYLAVDCKCPATTDPTASTKTSARAPTTPCSFRADQAEL
jgi:hypothetical protein